jgi:hypothetical protein
MWVRKHIWVVMATLALSCTIREMPPDHPKDHSAYRPPDETEIPVELVTTEPDRTMYELVTEVSGGGSASNMAGAIEQARDMLRSQARWYHATLVVIDTNNGDRIQQAGWSLNYQVVLFGRAFRKRPQNDGGPR